MGWPGSLQKSIVVFGLGCSLAGFTIPLAQGDAGCAGSVANSKDFQAQVSLANDMDAIGVHGGSLQPPPTQPSGSGFSGTFYAGPMNTTSPGSPATGSLHFGGSFGDSVSDTKIVVPTSMDVEYAPSSPARIDSIILQTSNYSVTHSNGVTSSPATLKLRTDLGPGGDVTASVTFVNIAASKDKSVGSKLNFFVNAAFNGIGPYFAVLQDDRSRQWGIQAADASVAVGARYTINGSSSLVLSHSEEITAAGTRGTDQRYHLLSDKMRNTRLTFRHGSFSYALEHDCQHYAGQDVGSCDITFQVSKQVQ